MQCLDRVGGVDHLPDGWGEGEERDDMLPGTPPDRADGRITLAPFSLELLEPEEGLLGVLGSVDRLDGGQDRLTVLPGDEGQAVADQVHDAGLHHGLWEYRGDRLGEALEPVDDGDQDVIDAAGLEFVDHLEPELGPFALLDP